MLIHPPDPLMDDGAVQFTLDYRAMAPGQVTVFADGVIIGVIPIVPSTEWRISEPLDVDLGCEHTITLKFTTRSTVQLRSLTFQAPEPAVLDPKTQTSLMI